jgi:chitinase
MKNPGVSLDWLEPRTLLSNGRVVGYFPDYAYSTRLVNKIDYSALTEINYFCVAASSKTGKLITNDPNTMDIAHLDSVVSAAHNHKVDVSLVVGGDGFDGSLPKISSSASLRGAFAKSVKSFAAAHHLDGLDLDWEPLNPTSSQISNYGKLIDAVRTGTSGLILSAAVNAEKLPVAPGNSSIQYVLNKQAMKDLDSIGVMAYDLDFSDHADFSRSTNDLKNWGNYLKSNGISRNKLVLGLPFYGRAGNSWADSQAQGYGDIIDKYVAQTGKSVKSNTDHLAVRFADSFSNKTVNWYFNGRTTISNKTSHALGNGYGGVMIWNLALDHYDKNGNTDKYSLLPAIKNTVAASTKASLTGSFSPVRIVADILI